MNMEDILHIRSAEETINGLLKEAEDLFQGREVVLREGKYRGRKAKIEAVAVDHTGHVRRGYALMFLTRPYSLRPGDEGRLLNTDLEARLYRPANQLFLIPVGQVWYHVVPDPVNEGAWQVQSPEGFLVFTTETCGPQTRPAAERVAATSNAELCRRMVA